VPLVFRETFPHAWIDLHHCLVKRLCTTPEPHLKKLLRKSYIFQNKANLRENVPKEAAFKCPAAELYKFLFLWYIYYALNLVDKLKWKTNFTLSSS